MEVRDPSTIAQDDGHTAQGDGHSAQGYAELHCISNYSFLRGSSHPEELVSQASRLGYAALAITDECSMAGVVKAHIVAKECNLKLVIGSEFHLDENIHLVLLAKNRIAYGQICNLITIGRRRVKGEYQLAISDLKFAMDQCLVIWIPNRKEPHHLACGKQLQHLFPGRLWLGLEIFPDGNEIECYEHALTLSSQLKLPLVAAGDVHMHHPDRKALLDIVSAIRMRQSVQLAGRLLFANREKYLRPVSVIEAFYPAELLANTLKLANLCDFSLDELRYEYPEELVPAHLSPSAYLRQLVEAGASVRWPHGEKPEIRDLIEKELKLIEELQYEYYFLTVFDIVLFARSQKILCQGRGSAANSVVCYASQLPRLIQPKSIFYLSGLYQKSGMSHRILTLTLSMNVVKKLSSTSIKNTEGTGQLLPLP